MRKHFGKFCKVAATLLAVSTLSGCSVEGWIGAFFPGDYERARNIAWCESRLDPGAMSPGGGNHGVFQINNVHRRSFTQVTGQPWSAVYEAQWNVMFAKWLYEQEGWDPWACA